MNQTYKIDILNIFLMLVSLILAVNLPFKLFLFSYAVLGPLHYLTEINWLNQKDFFVKGKSKFVLPMILFTLVVTLINVVGFYKDEVSEMAAIFDTPWFRIILPWATNLSFVGFILAIVLIVRSNEKWIFYALIVILSGIVSLFLMKQQSYMILFGVFFPTVIHVYFFTGFFILYGALKSNSKWGVVSFFVLMSVMFLIGSDVNIKMDNELIDVYMATSFKLVNYQIATFFQDFDANNPFQIMGSLGLKIQSFIAFAYLYHYLNWFTKTSTIKWHKMNTKNAIVIGVIWLASVSLYYIDYKLGLIVLLYLSYLHVYLEFPLNVVSIKGIFTHLFKK